MSLRYEIEEITNAVRIFSNSQEAPIIFQPHYPNGQAWLNQEDASVWAELCIASIDDQDAPYAPNGPREAGLPKLTEEEIKALQQADQDRLNGLN